jgi:uncharacterized delta-60 repeat protein
VLRAGMAVRLTLGMTLAVAAAAPAQAAPGDLDLTFGGTGIVTTPLGPMNDVAASVAVQADGKIVAAGWSSTDLPDCNGGRTDIALVRYNSDGTLDTSFGGTGKVITSIGCSASASSIALQGDGKIVIAGAQADYDQSSFAVLRYNPDGTLDTSFGAGTGAVITEIGDYAYASSVALQTDGKILAAGATSPPGPDVADVALVRYNPDGTLDTSFGAGTGKVTTEFVTGKTDNIHSVALQRDGKIVAGGASHDGRNYRFALVRYNSDGTLDTAFGGTGKVISADIGDLVNSIAVQGDGKIVAAGADFKVVRYNSDGTLDTSFGGTGVVRTSIGEQARAFSMVLQGPMGRLSSRALGSPQITSSRW